MDNAYDIVANTVTTYEGTLRMGAANFWRDEYTDEEGEITRGPTALLSLWVLGEESSFEQVRVHAGQVVIYRDYRIEVLEFGQDRGAPFVRVAISAVEGSED